MGLFSSRLSLTRYKVVGQIEGPVNETVYQQLKKNVIPSIETDGAESMIGWTSFEKPYEPDFEGYSFVFGAYLVFSLRIDKKTIPPKLVAKHYAIAQAKRLESTGLQFLAGAEKKALKEQVVNRLSRRIPATPSVYDLVWHYQDASLFYFSNLKSANEALETLFIKTFGLQLIRLFPYTSAELGSDLSDRERDLLLKLSSDNTK